MGNNLVTDGGNVDVYFTKFKSYVAAVTHYANVTPVSGILDYGATYTITNYSEGDDFTNLGAVNETGHTFIAKGDLIAGGYSGAGVVAAVWTNGSVLTRQISLGAVPFNADDSNYLGDVIWSISGAGAFLGTLTGKLTRGKTLYSITNNIDVANNLVIGESQGPDSLFILSSALVSGEFVLTDNILYNTPIRIDVYQ